MFKKLLIAADSSSSVAAVVACAGDLHRLGTDQALLAQYFMLPQHVAFPEQTRLTIEADLEPYRAEIEKQGIRTRIVTEPGHAGLHIPMLAEQENCSLMAVGSTGHTFSSELFLGGTAAEILHRASRPLLIVRIPSDVPPAEAVARPRGDLLRHVLFATDFSAHADHAFAYVLAIAASGAGEITLLHVQDTNRLRHHPSSRMDVFNRLDQQRLESQKRQLEAAGMIRVNLQLGHGSPVSEILKAGATAGLIVMGTHGRGFVSELFAGSVSHNVARHAQAPVLLIPIPKTSGQSETERENIDNNPDKTNGERQ